jgi:hypothetical protein
VIIATIFAGAFFAIALAGVLVLMRVGMNHEHRGYLSNDAPTPLARAMRTISGLHVQMPERDLQALFSTAATDADQDDNEPTSPGQAPRHLNRVR